MIYVLLFSHFIYGWKLSSVEEHFAPKPKVVGSNPQHSFNFFLCFYFFFLFFKYLDILLQKYIKIHMIFDLHELQHFSWISINVFSHFFKNFVFDVRVIFQTYIKTYGKNIFEIWEISDRFWPFLTILDHFRPFSTVFDRFRPLSTAFDKLWQVLTCLYTFIQVLTQIGRKKKSR